MPKVFCGFARWVVVVVMRCLFASAFPVCPSPGGRSQAVVFFKGNDMKLKHVAAAALLALGAASAQAISVTTNANLGTVGSAAESFGGFTILDSGSFSYAYSFTLDSLSNLSGGLTGLLGNVNFTGVSIGGTTAALTPAKTFSFSDMAAGHYTMVVNLTSSSFLGHAWGGSMMAQPVPEPQTVAMLLAGLGLMGAVAARRRRPQ